MSVLARLPVLGLLAAHPGTRTDRLRARSASGDASPHGTAAAPAAVAVPLQPAVYPRGEHPYPEGWWME